MGISEIKKIVALTTILSVASVGLYVAAEPQISSAQATADDTVIITLNVDAGISITSPADSSMSTNLGVSVNKAIATTTWNVKTNNNLGYTLAVKASQDPAMQSAGDEVLDYTESVGGTPETWSVGASTAEFGYSAFGTDVPTGTWGTGSQCSSTVNANSTTLKYVGFSTSDKTIATRSSTTTPSGIDSTVCYAVEQNGFYIPSGTYTATITATATTL
ncbi:MAG: hypothetical protein V4519_02255 [Patescibacteria group bacterium]